MLGLPVPRAVPYKMEYWAASTGCAVPTLCWQEEDDYESPNDEPEEEDDGDYESPNEEEEVPVEDDADYEPPPSNDEEALQNSILPAKPFPNTNSMYIGKCCSLAFQPWQLQA